jgi:hypothetical protein
MVCWVIPSQQPPVISIHADGNADLAENVYTPFLKTNQLLHKCREQTSISGQICTKTVNFTPDLGGTS